MSEPRLYVAGLLSGPATLLTSVGRALRKPWPVAALLLCLAAGLTEPFSGPLLAQETDDCDYVWCATATVKAATGSAGEVGYKPGADHPGSTLEPTGFTYGEVSYTVGGIVNDHEAASVTLLLSPLPDAETVGTLILSVGDKDLVFAEGVRNESGGAYAWTDSAIFGVADTPFVDGASIGLTIAEDDIPGAPIIFQSSGRGGDRVALAWNRPAHSGAGNIIGYRVEVSEDSGSTWEVARERVLGTAFVQYGLLADTTYHYRVSAINLIGVGRPSATVSVSTGAGRPPREPTDLSAAPDDNSLNLSWDPPIRTGGAMITDYRIETSTDGETWAELASSVTDTIYTDNGLTDGIRYSYRVAARNSYGLGSWSETVTAVTRVLAPAAPGNLSATADGAAIRLSWHAPASDGGAEITGYRIETSTDGDNWTNLVSSNTGTAYAHTGLALATTYYYRVSASNSAGEGAASETATTATATNPIAPWTPRSLTTTSRGTTMNLSWDAPASDGGAPTSGYRIETSTDGDTWTELVSSVTGTTYADTGLTVGRTYYYRVAARNSVGLGTASAAVSETARAVAPGAPQSLAATAAGTAINLSWDAPASDGGAEITGYRIETSTDGEDWSELVSSVTGTTYADTGLTIGTTHYYRIAARNSAGLGAASDAVSQIARVVAPGAPQNLAASAHGTTMNLSWDAPENDGGAEVTSYRIETSTDGDAWTELVSSVTGTTHADTGLIVGTTYHYQVTARNSVGLGTTSGAVSATVIANLPGAPQSLSAASGGRTSIDLSWDEPGSDGGSVITGYGIETSADGLAGWSSLTGDTGSTDTSYVHDGLAAATTVHYRVSAITAAGDGPASATASATTDPLTVPGAPHITSADAELDGLYIFMFWDDSEDDGGSALTGYRIEVAEGTDELDWVIQDANYFGLRFYVHEGISPGATWHHRISAINSVGVGAPSNVVTVTMPSIAPGPPQNLTATAGDASVDLSWDKPASDGGADVTGYSVEVSTDGESWDELESSTTDLSYSHTGFAGKTAYYYRVSAINSVGTGSPSDTASATSPAVAPGPPRNLSVTTEGTRFDLSWEAPASDGGADVTGYRIEISTDEEPWNADEDTPTGLSHSLTGLTVGVTYYFRVSAINSAGTGSPSAVESGVSSCDVWCATVTVMNLAGSTNFVGYGPEIAYPGSTLVPNTFTYDGVDYTVDAFFNKRDAGTVFVALSPALTESAKSALVLHIGTSRLPFGSAMSTGGISQWVPSTINLSNFGFADGATLSIEITASEEEEEEEGGEEE